MQVIVADNNPESRQALVHLLEMQPGINVLGEADEANRLLSLVREQTVDVVIIDYSLPGIPLIELIHAARSMRQSIRFVVMSDGVVNARLALNAGADTFVSRNETPDRLLETLQRCEMK